MPCSPNIHFVMLECDPVRVSIPARLERFASERWAMVSEDDRSELTQRMVIDLEVALEGLKRMHWEVDPRTGKWTNGPKIDPQVAGTVVATNSDLIYVLGMKRFVEVLDKHIDELPSKFRCTDGRLDERAFDFLKLAGRMGGLPLVSAQKKQIPRAPMEPIETIDEVGRRWQLIDGWWFEFIEDGQLRRGTVVENGFLQSAVSSGSRPWLSGPVISRNHGPVIVAPVIRSDGTKVVGFTRNPPGQGPAQPRRREVKLTKAEIERRFKDRDAGPHGC